MQDFSDEQLVSLFKKDHKKNLVFNEIVDRYKERLYFHIRRMVLNHDDTNDVLQNTLIKVWKGLNNFKGESKLYSWLYRIASNEAINFLNKKKKRFFATIDIETTMAKNLEDDSFFSGNEIELKLQKAILQLPEKQRLVFNMKYFEEMKYQDMSEILETSVGALKASYHHAVKKIEDFLKNN